MTIGTMLALVIIMKTIEVLITIYKKSKMHRGASKSEQEETKSEDKKARRFVILSIIILAVLIAALNNKKVSTSEQTKVSGYTEQANYQTGIIEQALIGYTNGVVKSMGEAAIKNVERTKARLKTNMQVVEATGSITMNGQTCRYRKIDGNYTKECNLSRPQ